VISTICKNYFLQPSNQRLRVNLERLKAPIWKKKELQIFKDMKIAMLMMDITGF